MSNNFFVVHNFNLKPYNSMRLEAYADNLIFPFNPEGVADAIKEFGIENLVVLGNGSNSIFSKKRYSCPIIITSLLNNIEFCNGFVNVDSGVSLSRLAWFALEHFLSGFEYLEDIPGSVGGALYMNAGTYEDNIGKQVVSVTVFDYGKMDFMTLNESVLDPLWGKRDSYFLHNGCFVISCRLKGKGVSDSYQDILEEMIQIKRNRYSKQPRNFPSAGSVFKRPYYNGEPRYIWKLFDEAGLRGFRIGDAQVSEKHPGFIVNLGNATGEDMLALLNYCKSVVMDRFGIAIEVEWKII